MKNYRWKFRSLWVWLIGRYWNSPGVYFLPGAATLTKQNGADLVGPWAGRRVLEDVL